MNAPFIDKLAARPADKPATGIDAFHRQRSRCIDAFATVEVHVIRRLKANGAKCGGEPLAQKIAVLAATPASPTYASGTKKKVDSALATFSELLSIRADIVHSQLSVVSLDGSTHARFVNSAAACSQYPPCRLLSFDQMRGLTQRVEELAGEFDIA